MLTALIQGPAYLLWEELAGTPGLRLLQLGLSRRSHSLSLGSKSTVLDLAPEVLSSCGGGGEEPEAEVGPGTGQASHA